MAVEENVKEKIIDLIKKSENLSRTNEYGQSFNDYHRHECTGWLSSALNIVQLIEPNPEMGYRKGAEEIFNRSNITMIPQCVGDFSSLYILY